MKEFKITKKSVHFIQYRIVLATRFLKPLFFKKPHCALTVFLTIDDLFKKKGWSLDKITFFDEYVDIIGTFDSENSPKQILRLIRTETIKALFGQSCLLTLNCYFSDEQINLFYKSVHHANLFNKEDFVSKKYQQEVPNKSVWSGYTLITTDLEMPHSRVLSWLLAQQSNFEK